VYARLSETYDDAEPVPTQVERGTGHAQRARLDRRGHLQRCEHIADKPGLSRRGT